MKFIETLENRKTRYHLGKNSPLGEKEIEDLVEKVLYLTPSAFNRSNQEVLILFGAAHDKFWDITETALRKLVGGDDFSGTEERLKNYRKAQGILLIYEDLDIIKGLQEDFPLYEKSFPEWSVSQSGMFQMAMWNAFVAEGLGANLIHYNPLVDEEVAKSWNVPSNWRLTAQMSFGEVLPEENFNEHPTTEGRIFKYHQ